MFKINSEKYIDLFTAVPNQDMRLSGWNWEVKCYFFCFIMCVVYTKKLIK